MTDPLMGGGLHDLQAIARHYYYEGKKNGTQSDAPLAFIGVCSVAIGCKILFDVYKRHNSFVEGLRDAGKGGGHSR